MFRRNNRSFSSISRNLRRFSSKATKRANRADQRWLQSQKDRMDRFARFRAAIRKSFSFVPMLRNGLFALWATMTQAFASVFTSPTRPIRVAVNRDGMLGGRKRRRKSATRARSSHKSDMSAKTYEAVEPRQMLASLYVDCLLYTSPSPRD